VGVVVSPVPVVVAVFFVVLLRHGGNSTAARLMHQGEAARGSISSYTPVHAEWYEEPEAVIPGEVLTHAAGPEDRRRAYRRYGAPFEVDGEGELTLKLDLNLDE